jgi:hypothetical protein
MGVPGDAQMALGSDRPSDDALWLAFAATLRGTVLPAVSEPWVRTRVIQLIALAEYARTRGADPARRRTEELELALDALAANALVRDHWPGDPAEAAAAALVAAVGRDDDAARAVRAVLRPVLVSHLDEDLALTTPLMDAFRGRLAP